MADDRANIKVSRETFDKLSEAKGDTPWDQYLRKTCLKDGVDIGDVLRAIDNIPGRTAERVTEELR